MVAPQPKSYHLLLHIPEGWTNDQKGNFFEDFIGELLKPMRFSVTQRIRFTGMEIDLLAKSLDDAPIPPEDLDAIVRRMKPPGTKLTDSVVHQYAMNLKRWLLFAGHLEERGNQLFRPHSKGAQMGIFSAQRTKVKQFMGCGTTDGLLKLLRMVMGSKKKDGILEKELLENGLRNAFYDAVSLGLVGKADEGRVFLLTAYSSTREAEIAAKKAVLRQPVIQVIEKAISADTGVTNATLGEALQKALKTEWKPASALRYANGLRGYYSWAKS